MLKIKNYFVAMVTLDGTVKWWNYEGLIFLEACEAKDCNVLLFSKYDDTYVMWKVSYQGEVIEEIPINKLEFKYEYKRTEFVLEIDQDNAVFVSVHKK